MPFLSNLQTSPGGSNINFAPIAYAYSVVTAYPYIHVNASASNDGIAIIANQIASFVSIDLTTGVNTTVPIQLKSATYGCLSGYSYNIYAYQCKLYGEVT